MPSDPPLRHYADVPIAAVTASAMPHEVEQALSAGMNAHIAKPVESIIAG